ncbi:MAG: glutathione S-transferase family protein [Methyloligellaceae bacterium]
MPQIILHHYQGSPFSEKIKLIFGYKNISWKSLEVLPIPPRPGLDPVFGNMRRIPVMQIGADYFCDSRLIADVIDHISPHNPLTEKHNNIVSALVSGWAEARTFVAAGPVRFQTEEDIQNIFAGAVTSKAIRKDRFNVMSSVFNIENFASLKYSARDHMLAYLLLFEEMLSDGRNYLTGSHPCNADFSVYHLVWWLRSPPEISDILDELPLILAWSDRIAAVGYGDMVSISIDDAILTATNSEPDTSWHTIWKTVEDIRLGKAVSIRADDYAQGPVSGTLVASTTRHVTLERVTPFGTVHIHFPKLGFEITLSEI